MTKQENAIAENKTECPIEGYCQVNNVVYKYDVRKIIAKKMCIFDLQRENGREVSITASYYLNTRDIPIRQHFQVTCRTTPVITLDFR